MNTRILVIDGDRETAGNLQSILESGNTEIDSPSFELTLTQSGTDGIRQVKKALQKHSPFALIFISRISGSHGRGLKTARKIREMDDDIYIVLVDPGNELTALEIQQVLKENVLIISTPYNREEILQMAWNFCQCWQQNIAQTRERQQLIESEHKYRELVEHSADAIVVHDGKKLLFANPAAVRMARARNLEEMLQVPLVDFVHPDFLKIAQDHIKQTLENGAIWHQIHERFIMLDRSEIDVEITAMPITYENKRCIQDIIRDITHRKHLEEAAAVGERNYRELVEHSADAIVVHDGMNMLFANPAALKMARAPSLEAFRKISMINFIHPDFIEIVGGRVQQILEEGKIWNQVYERYIVMDGSIIDVEVTAMPITFENKPCVQGIVRDITERKKLEKELQEAHDQLEEKVRERTAELERSYTQIRDLSSHMESIREEERAKVSREIHDELGQALTALRIDLSWLEDSLPRNKPIVTEKVETMKTLVDSTINTVQKISSELRPGLLDDLGLVPAMEWQVRKFGNRTGTQCHIIVDPAKPHLDRDLSTALFRILQEALTNVARHAQATKVDVQFVKHPREIRLTVKDDGKGVTRKQASDLKSFGLIGMRERVYPWNGEVNIRGQRNKGTTVSVSIPLDPV